MGSVTTGKGLQLSTPDFIDPNERFPRHRLMVMQFVLPIDAADVWPLVVDTATSIVFIQVPTGTVAAIHRGGFGEQINTPAAFHAAAASKSLARFRHIHP